MVAQGGGDVGLPGQSQDADYQVAQAGHDAGAVAGAARMCSNRPDSQHSSSALVDVRTCAIDLH